MLALKHDNEPFKELYSAADLKQSEEQTRLSGSSRGRRIIHTKSRSC